MGGAVNARAVVLTKRMTHARLFHHGKGSSVHSGHRSSPGLVATVDL